MDNGDLIFASKLLAMTKHSFNVQPKLSFNASVVTVNLDSVHIEYLHFRPGIRVVWTPPPGDGGITMLREYKVKLSRMDNNDVLDTKSPDSNNNFVIFEDYYDHFPKGGARITIEVYINGQAEANGYIIIEDIAQRDEKPLLGFVKEIYRAVLRFFEIFRLGKRKTN